MTCPLLCTSGRLACYLKLVDIPQGAVLGQGCCLPVFCCDWSRWPDSAGNCGDAAVAGIHRESSENCAVHRRGCPVHGHGVDVGENQWKLHRCSSWASCTRPLLLCGADGQTVQKTVEMPQLQVLNKVMDVPVIWQRQVPESCRGSTTGALVQTVQDTVWKCRSCSLLDKLSTHLLWYRGKSRWSSVRETSCSTTVVGVLVSCCDVPAVLWDS